MRRYLLEVDDNATAELNEKTFTLNGKPAFGLSVLANDISLEVLPGNGPFTQEDLAGARKMGQKEAWELAKKIVDRPDNGGLSAHEVYVIFGEIAGAAICNNTYEEAIKKVKGWEEEKKAIHAGDVVLDINDDKGVVLRAGSTHCAIMYADGTMSTWRKDELKKTGKTIDISAILDQLKKED